MKKFLAIAILSSLALTGCGSSDDFVFTQNTQVAAPICADDAFATNSNTPLAVGAANGVLANDTPNGATLTAPTTTTQGGTLAVAADGSLNYTPAVNFAGADTFNYTLTNTGGTVTCTATITVTAVNGFFVDATNGNDGTGNFTNGQPFATIQAAVTAAGAGANDIVVRPGNYTGTVNLLNNQRLLGSGSVLAQGAVPRPVLTGPVVMADGNTVDFIRVENSPADSIDANGQNGGTVTNCELVNSGDDGIGLSPFSGNWTIQNNLIDNTGATGVGIPADTVGAAAATIRINNNTIRNCTLNAIGFVMGSTGGTNVQVSNNVMTNNQAGFTFEIIAGGASVSCFDIFGNTNDDTYRISANNATPTLQVEDFANLITINNNSGAVNVPLTAPTDVAEGTCGF